MKTLLAHKETNKVKEDYNKVTYKQRMKNLIE